MLGAPKTGAEVKEPNNGAAAALGAAESGSVEIGASAAPGAAPDLTPESGTAVAADVEAPKDD